MKVQDHKGDEILVGSKCLYGSPDETEQYADYVCEVIEISEPDIVESDEGHLKDYSVSITVKFKGGDTEKLNASFSHLLSYDCEEEIFEEGGDLEVINPQKKVF